MNCEHTHESSYGRVVSGSAVATLETACPWCRVKELESRLSACELERDELKLALGRHPAPFPGHYAAVMKEHRQLQSRLDRYPKKPGVYTYDGEWWYTLDERDTKLAEIRELWLKFAAEPHKRQQDEYVTALNDLIVETPCKHPEHFKSYEGNGVWHCNACKQKIGGDGELVVESLVRIGEPK
jgi:hypothetical protein